MKNRIIFNFSFHPLQEDSKIILLLCEGIPYSVGHYSPQDDFFAVESYIFEPGSGTSSGIEKSWRDTEDYAKQWLIEKAIPKILAYYANILPDKR